MHDGNTIYFLTRYYLFPVAERNVACLSKLPIDLMLCIAYCCENVGYSVYDERIKRSTLLRGR